MNLDGIPIKLVSDGAKIAKYQFVRKQGESKQDYAARLAATMLEIHADKELIDWLKKPQMMDLYIRECWGRIKEFSNDVKNPEILPQIECGSAFFKKRSARMNITAAKVYGQIFHYEQHVQEVSEYYLLWLVGIANLYLFAGTRHFAGCGDEGDLFRIHSGSQEEIFDELEEKRRDLLEFILEMIDMATRN